MEYHDYLLEIGGRAPDKYGFLHEYEIMENVFQCFKQIMSSLASPEIDQETGSVTKTEWTQNRSHNSISYRYPHKSTKTQR